MINNVLLSSNFRYRHFILLSALAVVVIMLMFVSLPDINLLWRELQNTAHTILFALLAVFVLWILRTGSNFFWLKPFKLYAAACFISLFTGVLAELMQLLTQRDASTLDIARDFAGIITGLGLYASIDPELKAYWLMSAKWLRAGLAMLCISVLTVSLLPLAFLSAAYVQRAAAFPVVADLTASWARPFLQLKNAAINFPESGQTGAGAKQKLARIEFKNGDYPGVSIIETVPDWSTYEALTLLIDSKLAEPFELVLRIHDDQHNYEYADRFNIKLAVNQGENYFRIPLDEIKRTAAGRQMNMKQVREITIFSAQPAEGMYFYLGALRLE